MRWDNLTKTHHARSLRPFDAGGPLKVAHPTPATRLPWTLLPTHPTDHRPYYSAMATAKDPTASDPTAAIPPAHPPSKPATGTHYPVAAPDAHPPTAAPDAQHQLLGVLIREHDIQEVLVLLLDAVRHAVYAQPLVDDHVPAPRSHCTAQPLHRAAIAPRSRCTAQPLHRAAVAVCSRIGDLRR